MNGAQHFFFQSSHDTMILSLSVFHNLKKKKKEVENGSEIMQVVINQTKSVRAYTCIVTVHFSKLKISPNVLLWFLHGTWPWVKAWTCRFIMLLCNHGCRSFRMVCPSLSGLFIDNSVNGDFHAASVRPRNGLPLGRLCNKKYDKPGMRILNHDYNLGLPVSEVFCWGSLSKQNMHHRKRGHSDLEPGLLYPLLWGSL